MFAFQLMLLPFLECLVLVGIHSYLGLHVIRRKVIFVDLALAQIAALGAIVAFLFGLQPHSTGAYVFSLLFTFLGAAVFSLTRLKDERIPQEAVIGLVYALAAAIGILIIDRAPHGAEHIKEVLTGSILWVKGSSVAIAAVVYTAVGIFHWVFRKRFALISADPAEAERQGINVRLWDFLFYMSFGLVITHSVDTAGVLLVFVFLVVPAIMALLVTDRLGLQLAIGWVMGTLVSLLGLTGSYLLDFPTGPMVVATYGAALLFGTLVLYVIRHAAPARGARNVSLGVITVALITGGFWLLGTQVFAPGAHHDLHHGHPAHEHDHDMLDGSGSQEPHGHAHPGAQELLGQLAHADILQKEALLTAIEDPGLLQGVLTATRNPELHLALARRLAAVNPAAGRRALVDLLGSDAPPFLRLEALEALTKDSGTDFGYDALAPVASPATRRSLSAWQAWATSGTR